MSYNCNGFIYEIQPGDTLYGISRKFNVPIGWIINANGNLDIYNIYVGLRICIPDRSPNITVIPIVPYRPWPGNIGGPGPVIFPPVVGPGPVRPPRPRPRPRPPYPGQGPGPVRPPFPGQGPGPVRPPFPGQGPGPVRPGRPDRPGGPGPVRPGRNPFGRVAFGEEYDEDDIEITDVNACQESGDDGTFDTIPARNAGTDMNRDMNQDIDQDTNQNMNQNMNRDMNRDMDRDIDMERDIDMDRTMDRDRNNDRNAEIDRNMSRNTAGSTNGNNMDRVMMPARSNGRTDMTNGTAGGNRGTAGGGTTSQTPYVIISYVVKNDDNLSSILERFGISMNDVLRYNDLVEIYLKPGTILRVPNRNAMDEQKYEPSLRQ